MYEPMAQRCVAAGSSVSGLSVYMREPMAQRVIVVVAATFGSSVSGSGAYTREPMAQRPLATTCFSYALMCSDLSSHNVHQQEKTLCRLDSHDDLKHNPILDIVVFNARCESTPRPF